MLKENMRFWDKHPCGLHDKDWTQKLLLNLREERYAEYFWLESFVNFEKWSGKKVLEIGCGMGLDSSTFSELDAKVVCLDLSRNSLQIAKETVKGDLVCASANTMGNLFRDKFDLIYTFGVLHHIPDI